MGTHSRPPLHGVRDVLRTDPDGFARRFYSRLFAYRPDLRRLFAPSLTHQYRALPRLLDHVLTAIPDPSTHEDLVELLAQLGRDHRKFGVLPEHYEPFRAVLFAELAALFEDRFDDDAEADTVHAVLLITGVMQGAAESTTSAAVEEARVVEVLRPSRDLAVVRLVADGPPRWRAGQYVEVATPHFPHAWRMFSSALPPNPEGHVEFHIRAVPGGLVSPSIVTATTPGEVWRIAQPHGSLALPDHESYEDARAAPPTVLVAGGTGIAPLRALLLDRLVDAAVGDTHLIYAARCPGELTDLAGLREFAAANPWLTVTPVVESFANPWWLDHHPGGELRRGRAADVLAALPLSGRTVLVAGPPDMVAAVRAAALALGAAQVLSDPV